MGVKFEPHHLPSLENALKYLHKSTKAQLFKRNLNLEVFACTQVMFKKIFARNHFIR